MRWILVIITALFLNFNSQAGRKFLIETEKTIATVSLIDLKIGTIIKLMPGREDKMRFLFEVEDVDNFYLKFPSSLLIKLYSLSDKVESDWRRVIEDEKIPIKSFFGKNTTKKIELDEFILKSFMSNPLAGSTGTLRGNSIFYTSDNTIFSSPEKLSVIWTADKPVVEVKLYDMTDDYSEIFSTQSFKDTVFQFKNLPESIRKSFSQKATYCISLKTRNSDFGYDENQLTFRFDSLCFINQLDNLYFIDEQELEIKWNAADKETIVRVYDDEKNLVYHAQTTRKSLTFNESVNIPFKYKKQYQIELTQDKKCISKCFYILFSYQDYTKIK